MYLQIWGGFANNLPTITVSVMPPFLEANYDTHLLDNGRYPIHLKNRIKGGFGHLSNNEAFDLYDKTEAPQLQHLFLSHLSADNNHPDIALQLFQQKNTATKVSIAPRTAAMDLVRITPLNTTENNAPIEVKTQQLSLFN